MVAGCNARGRWCENLLTFEVVHEADQIRRRNHLNVLCPCGFEPFCAGQIIPLSRPAAIKAEGSTPETEVSRASRDSSPKAI